VETESCGAYKVSQKDEGERREGGRTEKSKGPFTRITTYTHPTLQLERTRAESSSRATVSDENASGEKGPSSLVVGHCRTGLLSNVVKEEQRLRATGQRCASILRGNRDLRLTGRRQHCSHRR
jgi:hypothetical protein